MAAKLREKDNGAKALLKRMASARNKKSVQIGVFESDAARNDGEATNVDVAAFAEFGTADTDARPWLSGWYDEQEKENAERLRKIGEAIVKGTVPSADVGLDRFGLLAGGEIRERVIEGIPPPLEPATIARKGSSTPLIDTEQFLSSITYRVKR